MMTLDEAIAHAQWCAENSCGECADDHKQLAEWLKELRQWKKLVEGIDLRPESLMKPFQPNVNDLERENEDLRELVSLMDERDALLPCMAGCNANCRLYDSDVCKCIASLMRALGFEVE